MDIETEREIERGGGCQRKWENHEPGTEKDQCDTIFIFQECPRYCLSNTGRHCELPV